MVTPTGFLGTSPKWAATKPVQIAGGSKRRSEGRRISVPTTGRAGGRGLDPWAVWGPLPRRAFARKKWKFNRDSPMDIPVQPIANVSYRFGGHRFRELVEDSQFRSSPRRFRSLANWWAVRHRFKLRYRSGCILLHDLVRARRAHARLVSGLDATRGTVLRPLHSPCSSHARGRSWT